MWTLSATASVMTMVAAPAEGGVSAMPAQPAKPIAVAEDMATTTSVTAAATSERRTTMRATTSTA